LGNIKIVCFSPSRFKWKLDRDCVWYKFWHSACYSATPGDSRTWASTLPDFHCAPQSCNQSYALGKTPCIWYVLLVITYCSSTSSWSMSDLFI